MASACSVISILSVSSNTAVLSKECGFDLRVKTIALFGLGAVEEDDLLHERRIREVELIDLPVPVWWRTVGQHPRKRQVAAFGDDAIGVEQALAQPSTRDSRIACEFGYDA